MKQYTTEEQFALAVGATCSPKVEGIFQAQGVEDQHIVVLKVFSLPHRGEVANCIMGSRQELVEIAQVILEELDPVSDDKLHRNLKRLLERMEEKSS